MLCVHSRARLRLQMFQRRILRVVVLERTSFIAFGNACRGKHLHAPVSDAAATWPDAFAFHQLPASAVTVGADGKLQITGIRSHSRLNGSIATGYGSAWFSSH